MWSILEEIRKYRWGRRYYLWVRIGVVRLGCNRFIPCYLRFISELSKVKLASMHYLDTHDADVEIIFGFSLYVILLPVTLVIYLGRAI